MDAGESLSHVSYSARKCRRRNLWALLVLGSPNHHVQAQEWAIREVGPRVQLIYNAALVVG
jgi:hypothetical protein